LNRIETDIIERIQKLIAARGPREMAARTGLPETTLCRYKLGRRRPTLRHVCEILDSEDLTIKISSVAGRK